MTPLSNNDIQAIQQNIDAQITCYERVVACLEDKKLSLVNARPERLGAIDQELVNLRQKCEQLEQMRIKRFAAIGLGRDTSLRDVIAQAPPQAAGTLNMSRQRLRHVTGDVQRLNDNIRGLLNLTLGWLADTMEIIATAIVPEGTSYNAQGQKARKKGQIDTTIGQSTVSRDA